MNRRLLTATLALLALAAGIAVTRPWQDEPAQANANPAAGRAKPWAARGEARPAAEPAGRTPASPDSPRRRPAGDHPAPSRLAAAPATKTDRLLRREANLQRRAQIVEQQANHELQRLIPLLGLEPDQQERVFKALVRSAPDYAPGLHVGGEALGPAAGSAEEALATELSDDQLAEYLQDGDERTAWWQEFMTTVAGQLEGETPSIGATVAAAPPVDGSGETAADQPLPTKELPTGFVEE